MRETVEQMRQDSDTIFTAISTGDFDDFKMAERAVVLIYVMSPEISRSGISHALKRLERFYAERPTSSPSGIAPRGDWTA